VNAFEWLTRADANHGSVVVLGAPISKASISASEAWSTPPAVRAALRRYTTWDAEHDIDVANLTVRDAGDVAGDRDDADALAAHVRIQEAVSAAASAGETAVVVVIGGDNSLTRPVLHGLMAARPAEAWGLLTVDAHHDCRPLDGGPRNGTPVRELIEAGLPGDRVAQVGIMPFANAADQARWAERRGVHVHHRAEVARRGISEVVSAALAELTAAGATAVHADLDVDAVERAAAPACPASLPGGIAPAELITAAHQLGRDRRVHSVDFTEVDANADVNGITVRLVAACLLAFCSGVLHRGAEVPPA